MFKVDIHFSDDTKLEIANASLFHVDGVETQPREIRLDNAKTLSVTFSEFENSKRKNGCVVLNPNNIVYIKVIEN